MSEPARITLLTDFGTADGYVAAMKAVIAAAAPRAIIDDASHDIEPGDIEAAAWALAGYWRLYEPPVVHLVVVDPGVGSVRRALAVEADGRVLVGPDNGVFTRVLADARSARVIELDTALLAGGGAGGRERLPAGRLTVSPTFHGRDIFAPFAAHLALGARLDEVGTRVADPVLLSSPAPQRDGARVRGVVLHVDRFGNLITNIPEHEARNGVRVMACGRECGLVRTYADVESGELLALIGSRGLLEVSVRDGSAAELLKAERGATVFVES